VDEDLALRAVAGAGEKLRLGNGLDFKKADHGMIVRLRIDKLCKLGERKCGWGFL
jgi:hypothetical protein